MISFVGTAVLVASIWMLPAQAQPEADTVEAHAEELITWIGDNSAFDVSHVSVPTIVRSSRTEIAVLLGFDNGDAPDLPLAAYRPGIVFLPPEFQLCWDDWMLLHELVHHVQQETGATYACKEEQERAAYELQVKFAHDRGGRIPNDLFIRLLECNLY